MRIYAPTITPEQLAPLLEPSDDPALQAWNRPIKYLLDNLAGIADTEATPERLAWLALWSRAWLIATVARSLDDEERSFVLPLLHRAAVELDLHCHLIIEPALTGQAEKSHTPGADPNTIGRAPMAVVADRLAGFAAWCIEQDRFHLSERRESLADLYDGSDARSIAQDPKQTAAFEALYGPLPLDNQHELDLEMKTAEAAIDRQLAWLDQLAAVPAISAWLVRFDFIRRQKGKRHPSVYRLLGASGDSVRARLRDRHLGFSYGPYSHASQVLHGSSLLRFLSLGPGTVAPDFGITSGSDSDRLEASVRPILTSAVNLHFMKGLLWPPAAA